MLGEDKIESYNIYEIRTIRSLQTAVKSNVLNGGK